MTEASDPPTAEPESPWAVRPRRAHPRQTPRPARKRLARIASQPGVTGRREKSSLTEAECIEALRQFRDQVVGDEMADWEPHRSILRDAMIETFVRQRFVEPDEWFDKVPGYLRQGTNPIEKTRYMDRICDIVAQLNDGEDVATRADPRGSPGLFDAIPERGSSVAIEPGGQPATPAAGTRNGDHYLRRIFHFWGSGSIRRGSTTGSTSPS